MCRCGSGDGGVATRGSGVLYLNAGFEHYPAGIGAEIAPYPGGGGGGLDPVLVDIPRKAVTMSRMGNNGGRRARRVFSEEFRAGAVRLVLEEGKSAGAVARDLDLTELALRTWRLRARAERTRGKSGGLTTAEREELGRGDEDPPTLMILTKVCPRWKMNNLGWSDYH